MTQRSAHRSRRPSACSPSLVAILAVGAAAADAQSPLPQVLREQKLSATAGSFGGALSPHDNLGGAVASVGDLDGNGVDDLAVGADLDDLNGEDAGAVWIVFLDGCGAAVGQRRIGSADLDWALSPNDRFGFSLARLGDLNGDGFDELAVGAPLDNGEAGEVYVLFLGADGAVSSWTRLAQPGGIPQVPLVAGDQFGISVARLDDIDGEHVGHLAVGADKSGPNLQGAVWILHLDASGTVAKHSRIDDSATFVELDDGDQFGWAVAGLGDVDLDGEGDLAVAAIRDDDGAPDAGAVWVLFLDGDDGVKDGNKISGQACASCGPLAPDARFGGDLAALEDRNGDGVKDLLVSAFREDVGGTDRGGLWILALGTDGGVVDARRWNDQEGQFSGRLDDGDVFGYGVAELSDLDGDGSREIAVGALGDDDGGLEDSGAVWVLFPGQPSLTSDVHDASIASGGVQQLTLEAGVQYAGQFYFVLGSASGTCPGGSYGGVALPLAIDAYTYYTLLHPGPPILNDTLGLLDANGAATASIQVPMGLGPGLIGQHLDHAALVLQYDAGLGRLGPAQWASNPAGLNLVP